MNKLHSQLKRFEKSKSKLWNSLSAEINPRYQSDTNTLFQHAIIACVSFILASKAFNTDEWCNSEYGLFFVKCQHKIRGLHTLLFLLAAIHSGSYFTTFSPSWACAILQWARCGPFLEMHPLHMTPTTLEQPPPTIWTLDGFFPMFPHNDNNRHNMNI